jgi:membrane-associated protease RseP (regulator of RpoE activity)
MLGVGHPPPLNDVTPLDGRRRLLAVLTMLIFLLVFVPVPLKIIAP